MIRWKGMGFKLKLNKYLLLISIFIVLLFSISFISASTVDNNANLTLKDNSENNNLSIKIDNGKTYSSSNINTEELSSDVKNWVVNQRNYKMFFDDSNVLKPEYGGQTLTFNGEFTDKGVITIDSPDTKVTGRNALFNNTVFNLKADGIVLSNLKFVLNETYPNNEYSGIFIKANNVTVQNIMMDYKVPERGTGFGIVCNKGYDEITGVNLINNTINYVGNFATKGYNYGVVLLRTENATVTGNDINCQLPLRDVDWSSEIFMGSSMDSVASFVADNCNNLLLSNNTIKAIVNKRTGGSPTLDCCLIYECDNAVIQYNDIYEEDYITPKGTVNYLYGLDLYLSDYVVIYHNNIHLKTTGGKDAAGTAYPVQITGPARGVQVAFNNICSISNGPNIGIYSQNYYGSTEVGIISNFINVTGYASAHSWSLVSGIEVQDSDDIIMNNTIIVSSVNEFTTGANIYGISYSQKTGGSHSYNIQYNNVTTNGQYAVALLGGNTRVANSIIANNILKTAHAGGNKAALITGLGNRKNLIINNTDGSFPVRKMSADEYTSHLKNFFNPPTAGEGSGFKGDGNSLIGLNDGNSANGFTGGNNGLVKNKLVGNNPKSSYSQAKHGNINSTHYNYGSSGIDIASSSSSSGAGGSSSNSENSNLKSYEVTKKIETPSDINYIQTISLILVALILLVAGYRRKEEKEDY